MGRYFSKHDARHRKHQPTYRLQRAKERAHYGLPFVSVLSVMLKGTDMRNPVACVTSVPPRPSRSRPPEFFEVIERACPPGGVPFRPELLRCIRDYQPQKELGGAARRNNVRGSFAVFGDVPPEHVVLIDDILTTGSTGIECARALLAGGAREVTIGCPGRTQSCISQTILDLDADAVGPQSLDDVGESEACRTILEFE